jgi:hypothetical protein
MRERDAQPCGQRCWKSAPTPDTTGGGRRDKQQSDDDGRADLAVECEIINGGNNHSGCQSEADRDAPPLLHCGRRTLRTASCWTTQRCYGAVSSYVRPLHQPPPERLRRLGDSAEDRNGYRCSRHASLLYKPEPPDGRRVMGGWSGTSFLASTDAYWCPLSQVTPDAGEKGCTGIFMSCDCPGAGQVTIHSPLPKGSLLSISEVYAGWGRAAPLVVRVAPHDGGGGKMARSLVRPPLAGSGPGERKPTANVPRSASAALQDGEPKTYASNPG